MSEASIYLTSFKLLFIGSIFNFPEIERHVTGLKVITGKILTTYLYKVINILIWILFIYWTRYILDSWIKLIVIQLVIACLKKHTFDDPKWNDPVLFSLRVLGYWNHAPEELTGT